MSSVVRLPRRIYRGAEITRAPDMINNYDFSSVYQPILSPTHRKLVGYEALVRVRKDNENISPFELFEQAEAKNLTAELDRHLLQIHLDNFAASSQPVWLFLNINPGTCIHPEASLEKLALQCQSSGIDPEKVVLELVETASDNPAALLEFILKAKAHGFQIAIDDFGMGDSNFERLWRINPLIVKLDRSLLVNAENHSRARMLLESLVKMIRESGSLVLLEGIENSTQAHIALQTEADLLQGFLFARPTRLQEHEPELIELALKGVIADSSESSAQDIRDCHSLSRELPFNSACEKLLGVDGVKRCFLLNPQGIQQGNLARANPDIHRGKFNPLYHSAGARWTHREYFRNALERPQHISSCRPYVGLPDAKRTVTLSTMLPGQRVFCVDIHPDEIFGGQLEFPATL